MKSLSENNLTVNSPKAAKTLNDGFSANGNEPTQPSAPRGFDDSTQGIARAIKEAGYELRHNRTIDCPEANGKPLDDEGETFIINAMYDLGYKSAERVRRVIAQAAYENSYNPLLDYYKSLHWDGEDHIGKLAAYFTGSDPDIIYRDGTTRTAIHSFLRRWLIGVIGKALAGQQNTCLVFSGTQGIGKSYLPSWLVRGVSALASMYSESPLDPHDKDSQRELPLKLIWELGELPGITGRYEINAIKNVLTMQTVDVRTPFDRRGKTRRVLASFFGTVNDDGNGFLHDKTGNRRFSCVRVTAINQGYSTTINQNDIWAQAYALYLAGETGTLSPEESLAQADLNKRYDKVDEFEDNLETLFDITGKDEDAMSGDLVASIIFQDGWAKSKDEAAKRAAPWLRRKGCEKRGVMKTWRGVKPRPRANNEDNLSS